MNLRALPSVEQLLQTQLAAELIVSFGRPLVLQAIRATLDEVRQENAGQPELVPPDRAGLLARASVLLNEWTAESLVPVINASGVILHTNLGRAPLSASALSALTAAAGNYSNLELDLASGKRGSRQVHVEGMLKRLTGAEAALVVNNNAAAVLLALSALAARRRVIIARSQLVEIGGGFRVPDVMKQSGARLVEVGTTNKLRLEDYAEALRQPTALVLHAHRSNFKIVGFTEEPEWADIVKLAHAQGVICINDLGSGALLPTEQFGLTHEPTVQEALAAGTDLVCFSGDKLLGGPQCGILLGRAGLIEKVKKHPLARAVRCDKTVLAALAATLRHYLTDQAVREIPLWRMLEAAPEHIQARARGWSEQLGCGEVVPSQSTVGGGSLPGETLPTYVLSLQVQKPNQFVSELRNGRPPVIARTENDRILLDPRTVLPEQDGALLTTLRHSLSEKRKTPVTHQG